MRAIRQHWSRVRKLRKNVARNAYESNLVLERLQAEVDDIVLRAREGLTIYRHAVGEVLEIRRYAAKGAETPIRQFVSKASHSATDDVTARSGLYAQVPSSTKQRVRRVGRKQRLQIHRHMARDIPTVDSVAADVRRVERTVARLSGLHDYVLSSIKQRTKRAGSKEQLRQPRIRRHVVRSTPARETAYRRHIISTRERKSRKMSPRSIRYINKLSIQRHPTYPVERKLRQRSASIRRIGQSRPRGSVQPRQQKRKQLLQTVSSWLEATSTNVPSMPVKLVGRVRRRPFGSRAVESHDDVADDDIPFEENDAKLKGLDVLMDTVKTLEQKDGRGKGRRRV
jgi:hypothetical protein